MTLPFYLRTEAPAKTYRTAFSFFFAFVLSTRSSSTDVSRIITTLLAGFECRSDLYYLWSPLFSSLPCFIFESIVHFLNHPLTLVLINLFIMGKLNDRPKQPPHLGYPWSKFAYSLYTRKTQPCADRPRQCPYLGYPLPSPLGSTRPSELKA